MTDELDNRQELDAEEAQDQRGMVACPRCEGRRAILYPCALCGGSGEVTYREQEEYYAEITARAGEGEA